MGVGAVIGANIIGGAIGSRNARKAAQRATDAQTMMQQKAIDEQRAGFDYAEEQLSPFAQFGQEQLGALSGALSQQPPGAEFALQNPLLQAMQEDVTRRLFANQAAKGKLGSGGTAAALQSALIPMALDFRQQEINNRQQNIGNLFSAAQFGGGFASDLATSRMNLASNIGNLQTGQGQAMAQGKYGEANARNQMIGSALGGLNAYKQPVMNRYFSQGSGFPMSPSGRY